MTAKRAQKFSYIVNTVILFMVFGLAFFFYLSKALFLVYFSIPAACVYLVGYYLIFREKLNIYVWMVYLWLTFYMGVTTVCLGFDFGFHLYCMSMVPIMFVTEYLAYKLENKSLKALPISICVCAFYLFCSAYVSYIGPVYEPDKHWAGAFWLMNSLTVFGFLIFYANWMIRMIVQSEDKLKQMAHIDKLTGLYNRHYMMELLEQMQSEHCVLAIADIDHFKRINDTYGHNAGDYVLQTMAELLKDNCPDAKVCRWGGEEFLILISDKEDGKERFEVLRKKIEDGIFEFEGQKIRITMTFGVAGREKDESIDKWIGRADEKLYDGKQNGRNRVVV